jgi:hypothetical protein
MEELLNLIAGLDELKRKNCCRASLQAGVQCDLLLTSWPCRASYQLLLLERPSRTQQRNIMARTAFKDYRAFIDKKP